MNHTTLILGAIIIFLLAGLGYATIPDQLAKNTLETETNSINTESEADTGPDIKSEMVDDEESESYYTDEYENEVYEDEEDEEEEEEENNTPTVETPQVNEVSTVTPAVTEPPMPEGYTLSQVAEHADASSCWTAVDNKVYDLTPFIKKHPGGASNIMKICGKDGTAAFSKKHGGDQKPENTLDGFYIGLLI